jgi:hypothetical protein
VTINILQPNTALSSNNSSKTQTTGATVTEKNEVNTVTKAEDSRKEASISTRAEKLQKLSKEFFPSGPQSLKITPQFIQRLQEYGFISVSQAEKLSPQLKLSETESTTKTVAQLEVFTNSLSDKLKKLSPESSLIGLLKESQSVLESFDKTLASTQQTNHKNLISKLSKFAETSDTSILSQSDKNGLKTLAITISLADKLGPTQSSTKEINQYLSILKGL